MNGDRLPSAPAPNEHSAPAGAGRVLVLDDEADIRNMLQRFLCAHGFEVRTVRNATQLELQLERQPYDLLLLDLMLPGEDGLSICRRLRAQGQTIPILMLTARGDPADRVLGLETGADDYLAKPFVPSELLARVRAMLRRQAMLERRAQGGGAPFGWMRFGAYRYDLRRQALWDGAQQVAIPTAELRLLGALAATPNRPVSRLNLLERVHGPGHDANIRNIDVQVLRLRHLVEADVAAPSHIRTVWGLGYMLIAEPEPESAP